MNLIEKLGGYEQANSKLLKMDKILKEVYYSPSDAQKANELRQALLEYRRQHNIFEVGDLSLTIDPWFGSNLLVIVDFRESETERYAIFSDGGFFRISGLRHATDEEIKAGKRLEVK